MNDRKVWFGLLLIAFAVFVLAALVHLVSLVMDVLTSIGGRFTIYNLGHNDPASGVAWDYVGSTGGDPGQRKKEHFRSSKSTARVHCKIRNIGAANMRFEVLQAGVSWHMRFTAEAFHMG
jgi:hypothetical protein